MVLRAAQRLPCVQGCSCDVRKDDNAFRMFALGIEDRLVVAAAGKRARIAAEVSRATQRGHSHPLMRAGRVLRMTAIGWIMR